MKLSTIATAVALALTWTTSLKAEEAPAKKGLSFVPFPMLAYDGAKGFLVGGMLNVYDFGNGESWPKPVSSYYADISIYTGGSMNVVSWQRRVIAPTNPCHFMDMMVITVSMTAL